MATITTINATDLLSASRAVINTNFANLNTDKVDGAAALTTAGRLLEVASPGVATQTSFASSAVLLSTGSYADPAWLTSLATSKLSGTVADANLASTAVTPAAYGAAGSVATFTVDAKGRITAAASVAVAIAASQVTSGTLDNARTTAASTNTVSAIVARDASGNFAAGTITATALNINGITAGMGANNVTRNTAFGNSALSSITTGPNNTAFGHQALAAATTADDNAGFGMWALQALTTGTDNSASGNQSLISLTEGTGNVAHGWRALRYLTTGTLNAGVGRAVLENITSSSSNTALGDSAGSLNADDSPHTSGSSSTFLGANTRASANVGFEIVIGKEAVGQGENTAVIGTVGNTSTQLYGTLKVSGIGRFAGTNAFSIGSDAGYYRLEVATAQTAFSLLTSANAYAGLKAKHLSIGATYGDTAPQTSGAIIEGVVGIGTNTPQSYAYNGNGQLIVAGTATSLSIVSGAAAQGDIAFADGTSGTSRYSGMIRYDHSTDAMGFWVSGAPVISIDGNYRFDVQSSGSAGTMRVYDQTATTGVSTLVVRAGAGQGAQSLVTITQTNGDAPTASNSAALQVISSATAGVNVGPTISFSGETGNGSTPYRFTVLQGAKASAVADNYSGKLDIYATNSVGGLSRLAYFSGEQEISFATGVKIGFFGVTPVVRQTATDLATVISLLQAYGLSN